MDWRDVRKGARYRRVDADGNGKGTAREIFGFFSASLVPRPLLPPNPRPPVPPFQAAPLALPPAAGRLSPVPSRALRGYIFHLAPCFFCGFADTLKYGPGKGRRRDEMEKCGGMKKSDPGVRRFMGGGR